MSLDRTNYLVLIAFAAAAFLTLGCESKTDSASSTTEAAEEGADDKGKDEPAGDAKKPDDNTTKAADDKGSETGPVADDKAKADPAAPVADTGADTKQRFVPANDRQKELLKSSMESLTMGDNDGAVMRALALTKEGDPASIEQLVGFLLLAEIYGTEGKHQKAIDVLEKATPRFPPNVEIPTTLAGLYTQIPNQEAKVVSNYQLALVVDPNRVDVLAKLANAADSLGLTDDVAKAEADYENALTAVAALISAADTPLERKIELVETTGAVIDARIAAILVDAVENGDAPVVQKAFEMIVNAGHKAAIPLMEALVTKDGIRPEIKAAIPEAVAYMKSNPHPPELPIMPLSAARKAAESAKPTGAPSTAPDGGSP